MFISVYTTQADALTAWLLKKAYLFKNKYVYSSYHSAQNACNILERVFYIGIWEIRANIRILIVPKFQCYWKNTEILKVALRVSHWTAFLWI